MGSVNNLNAFNLDCNQRPNECFQNTDLICNNNVKRVTSIALPFFCLFTPTRHLVNVGFGLNQMFSLLSNKQSKKSMLGWFSLYGFDRLAGKDTLKKIINFNVVVIHVSYIACSILMPVVTTAGGTTLEIIKNIQEFRKAEDPKQKMHALLKMLANSLFLSSLVVGSTELILASILVQMSKELIQAYSQFNQEGKKPESIANLCMVLIRAIQASVLARQVHTKYFCPKSLNQDSLKTIIAAVERRKSHHPEKEIDFGKLLDRRNVKREVEGVSFSEAVAESQDPAVLKSVTWQNLRFRRCDFSGVNLERGTFHDVTFEDSLLHSANLNRATVQSGEFVGSELQGADFTRAEFFNSAFKFCNLDDSLFVRSDFRHSLFWGNSFNNTDFSGSTSANLTFLQNSAQNAHFNNVDFSRISHEYGNDFEGLSQEGSIMPQSVEPMSFVKFGERTGKFFSALNAFLGL